MIGDSAPTFTGQSTMGAINFPDDYYGKWKILFSHPADFTPVCSTEILELAKMQDEFADLKTQILVISTDGINSHIEWVKSLEEVNYKNRLINNSDGVNYRVGYRIISRRHFHHRLCGPRIPEGRDERLGPYRKAESSYNRRFRADDRNPSGQPSR
jgi:hypothetical protein